MTQLTRFDRSALVAALACLACSATLSGCFKTSDAFSSGNSALDHDGGVGSSHGPRPDESVGTAPSNTAGPDGSVGSLPTRAPVDPAACTNGGSCTKIFVDGIDKVDLLFAIGNSSSMSEEQALLREQFSNLIFRLTSGDYDGDGTGDGPAADTLQLGVVSSDLGAVGITGVDHCAGLGDDGLLQHEPRLPGCFESYPRFLAYDRSLTSPDDSGNDLACIATLGTNGCGFEQPLESSLKALWPAADSRVTFLADENGSSARGHGDNDNGGFVRNDLVKGLSVIAIVVVSDEEDCSSKDMQHLTPAEQLDPNDPASAELRRQGMGVRCALNQENLFIIDRYVHGLRALQPGREDLVVFAAIAGVPPQTVSPDVLHATDFSDPASRDDFYAQIENDDAMRPVVDDHGTVDVADDTMRPACTSGHGSAEPARRLVAVAKDMGKNGIVQSICEDDYGPAMDAIAERISANLGAECLASPLTRNADHMVDCDVIWELQPPGAGGPDVPTECGERSFLLPLPAGAMQHTADGGARCLVAQMPITSVGGTPTPGTTQIDGHTVHQGWYYDDFSPDALLDCRRPGGHRIGFTSDAHPPTNVGVVLDCKPSASTN